MLVITSSAELRLQEVTNFLRELDSNLEIHSDPAISRPLFWFMLLRKLEYLRQYHLNIEGDRAVHDGAVTLHPDAAHPGMSFSLVWARKESGPHMQGLLHWNGPNLSTDPREPIDIMKAKSWEWSTHT